MRNLYFKTWVMNSLSKSFCGKKLLLWILVVLLWYTAHTFAQTELYFSPANVYPILNTSYMSYASKLKVNALNVLTYGADLRDQSQGSW